jgi:hypothetical protein
MGAASTSSSLISSTDSWLKESHGIFLDCLCCLVIVLLTTSRLHGCPGGQARILPRCLLGRLFFICFGAYFMPQYRRDGSRTIVQSW